MAKIETTSETILIPMMSGEAKPQRVETFHVDGKSYSARQVSPSLCYILHRATGLKITAEHTGDIQEAAEGFALAVNLGAYNLAGVEAAAAKSPILNAESGPERKPQWREEAAPHGVQYVMPGCEKKPTAENPQLDLF